MRGITGLKRNPILFLLAGLSLSNVLAGNVLSSSGFTNCENNATITVNNANVEFDRSSLTVIFDVSGTSSAQQKVIADLTVSAYGNQVYQKTFNPCDAATFVGQLCPVAAGNFAARGSQVIPTSFASQIPAIAFSIPDLDGEATLKLTAADGGQNLACIQSGVTNGQSLQLPAVTYVAAGIAGGALLLTGLSALGGGAGAVGGHSPTPSFSTVILWFQGLAMNGMMSVNYPPVYRSFTKNFGFSTGLVPWTAMQTSIDNFRNATGGNLTANNVQYLQNATLVFTDGSSNTTTFSKRNLLFLTNTFQPEVREVAVTENSTQTSNGNSTTQVTQIVHGISGYVEQLTIPQANTFMTVLLVFAIVIAAITVGILLFKVILETWALFASFPKKLTGFRKRYWSILAKTIVNLILLLYGVWTLYCIFQFTNGDSWAAKLLAGITLGIFTAVLGFFTFRIWYVARKYRRAEGDISALYENKETWLKYSLFYDTYKRQYWWLFMPAIIYMFAKGCVIAAGDGHGLTQTVGQLIIESLMFLLLLFTRPYATKGGNWLNIIIQVVRGLSVVSILLFVETFGIAQTTKTITGIILIAVQSALSAVLAILIAVNAIITCCKENPHRKRRKAAEKLNREFDNLTPLDARNSLLIDPSHGKSSAPGYAMGPYQGSKRYDPVPNSTGPGRWGPGESVDHLVPSAADMGYSYDQSDNQDSRAVDAESLARQPTVPDVGMPGGYAARRVL
ncbi:hypothetical protein MMC34_007362 [Xylographa carneopallida]|nr:hypothetical protein [Xylographa carneopallida]